VPEPRLPDPIPFDDPAPARPDFNPEELTALFYFRDGLLHGLMLPRIPGTVLTISTGQPAAELLLSALSKLLED
jgi:hypothetical protein